MVLQTDRCRRWQVHRLIVSPHWLWLRGGWRWSYWHTASKTVVRVILSRASNWNEWVSLQIRFGPISQLILSTMVYPEQSQGIGPTVATCQVTWNSSIYACGRMWTSHTGGLMNRTQAAYIWSTWQPWKIITLRLMSKVDGLQQLPSCCWLSLLLSGLDCM